MHTFLSLQRQTVLWLCQKVNIIVVIKDYYLLLLSAVRRYE